jgi:hypothetical protein
MAEKIDEVEIDLDSVELQGWEDEKSANIVLRYVIMTLNDNIPPRVEVVKVNGVYQVMHGADSRRPGYNYGGHHRAVAHWIARRALPCNVFDTHRYAYGHNEWLPITRINLIGETVIDADFLRRIPSECAKRFLERWKDNRNYVLR